MKRILLSAALVFGLVMIFWSASFAQGIGRSKGLGIRTSFWNVTGEPTQITLSNETGQAKVDLSGAGIGFYFFSRAYYNWFFELSLGVVGGVQTELNGVTESDVNIEAIAPLLVGLRYDIFATRLSGSLQPYLTIGGGPYWQTSITATNRIGGSEESVKSNLDYGYYVGGGVNWVLLSWFAFNFDLKHHFIEFEYGKDYSGFQFGLGFSFMWGQKREIFELIGVKLVANEIYPAYQQYNNITPIALVTVKNLIGYPIEINVRCEIKSYSERPKYSGFIRLEKGETKDIRATAFFGKRLNEMSKRRTAVVDLQIEGRASKSHTMKYSTELTIHSKNAWNGEIDKLSFFLTPEDENILKLSRKIIDNMPPDLRDAAGNFQMARYIFRELKDRGINYFPDPNIPFYQDDRIQFANETLEIESGDCDDLVVLFASLLESVGIKTAFVEVRDPKKSLAHLYLMFNSGLNVSQSHLITSNDKRYVVRENSTGQNLIWIPIETTLIERGFEQAWETGALNYLQEGIIRSGINEGWVIVIENN